MSVTSQINWSPHNSRTFTDPLSVSADRPSSSYGRVNGREMGEYGRKVNELQYTNDLLFFNFVRTES